MKWPPWSRRGNDWSGKLIGQQGDEQLTPHDGETIRQFENRLWDDLPIGQRERIVRFLNTNEDFLRLRDEVKERLAANPDDWWIEHHMGWGMWVRNTLRDIYRDDELPSGNWDDYYIAAVEAALREDLA